MSIKRCAGCGLKKPIDEFHTSGTSHFSTCKVCRNAARRTARTTSADDPPVRDTLRDMPQPVEQHVEEKITIVDEHRLKRKVRDLESQVEHLTKELSDGGEYNELTRDAMARQREARPLIITPRERTSGLLEATPLVLASDWHLEEEVRPEQVSNRNRYNLEIARQRVDRFFGGIHWMLGQQRETFKIRSLILALMGDFITNFLHEDNIETNLLGPLDATMFAYECIGGGIDSLLTDPEIEQFALPCVDGNHARLTKKLRQNTRQKHSLEQLLYSMLAQKYKHEPRIRFVLPTSQFTYLDDVYGRVLRITHMDTFRYIGGIGGLTIPLLRALASWESVRRADLTIGGHWHQRINLPTVMVNGSLIGFNNYAMSINCKFEHPVQSVRMLDPQRWCSTDIPLWVAKLEDDLMHRPESKGGNQEYAR